MRVGIVFFPGNERDSLLSVSKGLAKGIESQGHQVDIIDGEHDVNTKLTIYKYLVIGATGSGSMGGRIPDKIAPYLSSSGMISGKKSFAFILKKGLRLTKTLRELMAAMEHEGMFVKFSEILSSPEEAEAIGKRLHIG